MGNVIVIGSINSDITVTAARQPRPGETVFGSGLAFYPGGKGANQAVAAARAGAPTRMVANVGEDPFAAEVLRFLRDAGVDASAVRVVADLPTGTALIVVDADGENSIVVVSGANASLDPADVERTVVERGDVVVTQLEVPVPTVVAALARARSAGATTMLNAAPAAAVHLDLADLADLADVLVVNEIELSAAAHAPVTPEANVDDIRTSVSSLGRGTRGAVTVVTLGARGVVAFRGEHVIEIPGRRVDAVDTTGAGDCFVGTLAACLAAKDPLETALGLANVAASICVERPGAGPSMPTLAEILARAGP